VPLSGVLSSARGSSADKGEAMAHELSVRIAAAITHEFG
jgi:creatinine amidohydrolase